MDSEDTNGNWGFQVQKLSSEAYKALGADKAKVGLPYLGNLKILLQKKSTDSTEPVNIEIGKQMTFQDFEN